VGQRKVQNAFSAALKQDINQHDDNNDNPTTIRLKPRSHQISIEAWIGNLRSWTLLGTMVSALNQGFYPDKRFWRCSAAKPGASFVERRRKEAPRIHSQSDHCQVSSMLIPVSGVDSLESNQVNVGHHQVK
jgi:hypothetical protein